MIYLLDTNIITLMMRDDATVDAHVQSLHIRDEVATCTTAKGEAVFGVERLPQGKRRNELKAKLNSVLAQIPCHPLAPSVAEHYAATKAECKRKGIVLDENDLWIAATALYLGATLVSRDADFTRVDGLSVVSWT